ncbi:AarF/ABC1/UbiB kinase family protein [Pseudomaricurvus alkylphenolicus]|jgi:predicted unusual protein kinase regulating ubiquinone biosynthesis (AarF/ABC1/UbiB family)|uniref:ABC1 kinase family protein n=1 Tax=Pseudomaricurvus alkylphenolicus TaxID=1306991 RepID=UPI0014242643|nr:AarF/ABC1/UbiB kinase family protein [Pseudomaricurvus alkylphenolicus]NIB39099.1 AarF/ABC1/UbiB kinase family protein [Pseudomaricurvus alkylphenolicus]
MASKFNPLRQKSLLKGLNLSLAGARTGGALLVDKALNKVVPGRDHNPLLAQEARKLVARLGQMKGTYVKVGQMLALVGEYVLPAELTDALRELESATEALPWVQVEAILRERLGADFDLLEIEPEPIGVASLAQVHRARVRETGESICLKFLYPGIRESIDHDFEAVTGMLKLTRWLKTSRSYEEWIGQFKQQLLCEVDYDREMAMTEKVASLLAGDDRFLVPAIVRRFCRQDLIAMEYLQGETVTSAAVAELSQARRDRLGSAMLDLLFKEIFDWQLLQSDPNMGNYRIAIGEDQDRLVLLDFGSMLDVGPSFFEPLGETILGAQQRDAARVVSGLMALDCLRPESSECACDTFVHFCVEIMEPMRHPEQLPEHLLNEQGHYRWAESKLMKRAAVTVGRSATHSGFELPSEHFSLVSRKLIGVFTFITLLRSEFNGWPLLQAYTSEASFSPA